MSPTLPNDKKTVIITGGTSGIGEGIVAMLSSQGANVFFGGRRAEQGEQIAAKTQATFHVVDVADEQSNKAFFDAAAKHFDGASGVDAILLNAGVEGEGADQMLGNGMKIQAYDFIFNINVRGVLFGLQYGAPLLKSGGSILVTSSGVSLLPLAANPAYAASKAAVDSLVKSYAAQVKEADDERLKSIRILSMNPVAYKSEMVDRFLGTDEELRNAFAASFNPSGRLGQPEELAGTVWKFVQGELPYQSGDNFVVDVDTHFPLSEYFERMPQKAN